MARRWVHLFVPVATWACTQPNGGFELGERADSGAEQGTSASMDTEAEGGERGDDATDGRATEGRDTEANDTEARDTGASDTTGGAETWGETEDPVGMACNALDGCGPNHYCSFPTDTPCGFDRVGVGVCKPRPEDCTEESDPVIACDCGPEYENACLARMEGYDVLCRVADAELGDCLC
jgi:hypothetical protein